MTVSPEDRQHLITNYHEKAQKIVQEIPVLIELDQLFTAVNRIYYALYYMLSA